MMANTYTLIASNTLGSSAASVTFSSIPQTYTDLILKISTRSSVPALLSDITIRFNGDSSALYSYTAVYGRYISSYTVTSDRQSNKRYLNDILTTGADNTSNTFSNSEIYIPSYTASQNKPVSVAYAAEGNYDATFLSWSIGGQAGLWRNTAAITSIELQANQGNWDILSGSSFFLYGIKNS